MALWVNGQLRAEGEPSVSADDHGIVVGDGVFETCLVSGGVVFAPTKHLRRLRSSAAGLGLEIDDDFILSGIRSVLSKTPDDARLRITVTGGPSPYGTQRGDAKPTVLLATTALHDWPASSGVIIVPWPRSERSATAGLKTISYAENVIALRYAEDRGGGEAIFVNTRGELCEGTGSNVFLEHDGMLVTPPLSSGCLAGVTRELLLEWLSEENVAVSERALPVAELRRTKEAFLTSTTRGVQMIDSVDGVPLDRAPGQLTNTAAEIFARRAATNFDP